MNLPTGGGCAAADIAALLGEHAVLAIVPVLAAFVVSVPLGYLVFKTSKAANPILAVFGVIYSIPRWPCSSRCRWSSAPRSSARSTSPWPWRSTRSRCWSAAWSTDCVRCRWR